MFTVRSRVTERLQLRFLKKNLKLEERYPIQERRLNKGQSTNTHEDFCFVVKPPRPRINFIYSFREGTLLTPSTVENYWGLVRRNKWVIVDSRTNFSFQNSIPYSVFPVLSSLVWERQRVGHNNPSPCSIIISISIWIDTQELLP